MEEPNNCPKPNCGRPETTSRQQGGKRFSICGNGHSWNAAEVAAQRAKAREAEAQESLNVFDSPLSAEDLKNRYYDFERRYRASKDRLERYWTERGGI